MIKALLLLTLLFTNYSWAEATEDNQGPVYLGGSAEPGSINAGESIHFESAWYDPEGDAITGVRVGYCLQGTLNCVAEFLDRIEHSDPIRYEKTVSITQAGIYDLYHFAVDAIPFPGDDALHSEEELGWYYGGTFTVVGSVSPTIDVVKKLPQVRTFATRTNGGDALTIDAQLFPFVNLLYDTDNLSPLTEENFSVSEDGRTQTIWDFIPPESSGGGGNVKIADIVFVLDDSGSMDDEAAQVKANIASFANQLSSSEIDFRLALVPYGGSGTSGGKILHNGNLHSEVAPFVADVDQMRFGGSTERAFQAMQLAVQNLNWRPTTQKVLILVTDEDNDAGGPTESELITELQNNNVTVYGLTLGHPEFNRIADATGGQVFNILDDFSSILTEIGTEIAARYTIQYKTDNPAFDGQTRTVDLIVTKDDGQSQTITGTYTSSFPIEMTLTQSALNTKTTKLKPIKKLKLDIQ